MFELDTNDPFDLFDRWFKDAEASEPNDPNAMTVATVDGEGRPSARILLLKGVDPDGFVFYTNFQGRKGRELLGNPNCALCFHWKSLLRQVRVEGPVAQVSDGEADEYFQSRRRGSRIGAWASLQSQPLADRDTLLARVDEYTRKFEEKEVPRPPHWSGFRLVPRAIEFWQDGEFRLHDRFVFQRSDPTGPWTTERLFP